MASAEWKEIKLWLGATLAARQPTRVKKASAKKAKRNPDR
jgi:hypothetical protein